MTKPTLRQALLALFYTTAVTVASAQQPADTSFSSQQPLPSPTEITVGQPVGPGPVATTEVATPAPVAPRPQGKSFSKALSSEAQTLDQVTISYLRTVAADDYLRILPTAGRKPVVAAPFGIKGKASVLPAIRQVTSASLARSFSSDSSLQSLVDWYQQQYGFHFIIRRTPLGGSHNGDTLTIARGVQRIENTIVSIMIWNPTSNGKGRKVDNGSLSTKTSIEVQERTFRPREELIAQGPDAVVELTWQVPYRDLIQKVSIKYQIDPFLFAALVQQESNFNSGALSVDSAAGLTQMIPGTAAMMGVTNPHDPRQSLEGGARYLKMMLDRFNGDAMLALAAYNAGPGNVIKYKGIPPFAETRDYVKRIMARYREKAGGSKASIAQAKVAS